MSGSPTVPKRLFVHNESLDFAAAVQDVMGDELGRLVEELLKVEVAASRRLRN